MRRSSARASTSSAAVFGGMRSTASGTASTSARRVPYSWDAPCTASMRHDDERGIDLALVAEQRRRDLDVGDHRRAPERRGALHRQLGDEREHVVDRLVAAERQPVAHAVGEHDGVPDVRARVARAAGRSAGRPRGRRAGPPPSRERRAAARRAPGSAPGADGRRASARRTGRSAWPECYRPASATSKP